MFTEERLSFVYNVSLLQFQSQQQCQSNICFPKDADVRDDENDEDKLDVYYWLLQTRMTFETMYEALVDKLQG